ncbi:inhibitor of growth protein 1-like [Saccostrea cucullata]|uniref:inhibitor of growth protein 1-like n=1 Tax=Saccostrea cuccullata TaxID=36930 RepID=UPI002ED315A4
MSMLNQAAVEALCSATYLENYLDTMENLPDDLQRVVTQMRELDIQCRDIMQDIDYHQEIYTKEVEGLAKKKALMSIQRALIRCQEIGDEKLGLMTVIAEHIENRQRQLEQDRENLDPTSSREIEKEEQPLTIVTQTKAVKQEDKIEKMPMKRQRRQKTANDSITKEEEKKDIQDKGPKKKKKRKAKEDDPSFLDSMAYWFGLEDRIDECKDTSDIVKALLVIIIIEIVWVVMVFLEPRKPLIKMPETRARDFEEEHVINAIVTDAMRSAQQSFSS